MAARWPGPAAGSGSKRSSWCRRRRPTRACRPSRPRARGSSTSKATTTPPSCGPRAWPTTRHLVIADTSWPGYEEIPRRVVEGYATIFAELDAQLDGRPVDLVVVPIGVGSLAAAAARHFRARPGERPRLVGLEPIAAACALASARAGEPVTVDGDLSSVMAGLNCPTPSADAWPQVAAAFDAFCAVGDRHVLEGMRRLAAGGLDRGGCAGGVVGGLTALLGDPAHRAALDLPEHATALLVLTEGVTDRELFAAAVGREPAES